MMSVASQLPVCLFVLALFGSTAHANGSGSTYPVRVLGCELPVPTEYVLDATYKRSFVLLHAEGEGQIQIEEFTGIPERFTIVSERTEGRLVVVSVAVKSEGRAPDPMVVVHDAEHSVSLIGAARNLERSFLEACLASK